MTGQIRIMRNLMGGAALGVLALGFAVAPLGHTTGAGPA